MKPASYKWRVKKQLSSLQGFTKTDKKKLTISKYMERIRKMLNDDPEEEKQSLSGLKRDFKTKLSLNN